MLNDKFVFKDISAELFNRKYVFTLYVIPCRQWKQEQKHT